MSSQASKRMRELRKTSELMPVLDGCSGTKLDDRLWIYRSVGGSSLSQLSESTKYIKPEEASRKWGRYSLTLMYPEEVHKATSYSVLQGFIKVQSISERLAERLPDSIQEPVMAESKGLRQYHGVIGVELSYPEYDNERQAITTALNEILDVNYEWQMRAHVSIARGQLARITNLEQLESEIPSQLELLPVNAGLNI